MVKTDTLAFWDVCGIKINFNSTRTPWTWTYIQFYVLAAIKSLRCRQCIYYKSLFHIVFLDKLRTLGRTWTHDFILHLAKKIWSTIWANLDCLFHILLPYEFIYIFLKKMCGFALCIYKGNYVSSWNAFCHFCFLQVTLVKMVNEATENIPNWETL